MTDLDVLRGFLERKRGVFMRSRVILNKEPSAHLYSYVAAFCAIYVIMLIKASVVQKSDIDNWAKVFDDTHLLKRVYSLLSSGKHPTMQELTELFYKSAGKTVPYHLLPEDFAKTRVVDWLCRNTTFQVYMETLEERAQDIIPQNAIDRFFYKTGRGLKNTKNTIKESKVVENALTSKIFLIILYFGLAIIIGCILDAVN